MSGVLEITTAMRKYRAAAMSGAIRMNGKFMLQLQELQIRGLDGKVMLSHANLGEVDMRILADLMRSCSKYDNETELVVSYNTFSLRSMRYFLGTTRLHGFAVLELFSCGIGDNVCEMLANVLSANPPLKRLKLGDNKITQKGVRYLAIGLKKNETLIQIHLGGNKFGDCGIKEICKCFKENRTLTSLGIRNVAMTYEGMQLLALTLQDNECPLLELSLRGNKLGLYGSRNLGMALVKNNQLRILELQSTYLSLCPILLSGLSKPNLRSVVLSDNKLLARSMELFRNLEHKETCLSTLNLENCCVGTLACVETLCNYLESDRHLKNLVLRNNDLSNSAHLLCRTLALNIPLTTLNVNTCCIEEGDSVAFAAMLEVNSNLTSLDFGGKQLNGRGRGMRGPT